MTDILITANHLLDGSVLWLGADLKWHHHREAAGQFDPDSAPAAQQAAAHSVAQNQVISVYDIAIDGKADTSMRETVRAAGGPSITPPADHPSTWPAQATG